MSIRTIICTTGTSIAAGIPIHGQSPEAYGQAIRERVAAVRAQFPGAPECLRNLCAETNSLQALKAGPEDDVILLHTDTAEGDTCARLIAELLPRLLHVRRVELRRINGLQVDDPDRFRRDGIRNLFAAADDICRPFLDAAVPGIVLNVTGGYKSVVPYLTLYGLINRLPVVYIFERSDRLLTLPSAPVAFDVACLARARDALVLLFEKDLMPRDEFFGAIPGLAFGEQSAFECFLEEVDGLVAPSAFARLLHRKLAGQRAAVLLSPSARQSYAASRGPVRDQFTFMLERVGDPLWREQKIHPVHGTDLTVFKPGRTSERMLARVDGLRVYVCELMQHDEYVHFLSKDRSFAQYPAGGFEAWVRPADVELAPETDQDNDVRLDLWLEENDYCKRQLVNARAEAEAALKRASRTDETLSRRDQEILRLLDRIGNLEAELALALHPWWRRLFRR